MSFDRLIMPIGEVMFTQRSVRKFRPDPIPAEDLRLLVEAAVKAPNGGNHQIGRFLLITDREKIRAFGQVRKHLEDKGWVNPRVRDLYDLWWVTTQQKEFDFDWKAVRAGLDAKCPDVGLAVRGRGDFEDGRVLDTYKRVWGPRLAPLLSGGDVPDFNEALRAYEAVLGKVFPE